MKLIIAIAHERDKHKLGDALLENGLTFTKLGSTGGFLRQGNVTVLIGVDDEDAARVLDVIKDACQSSEGYVNLPGEMVGSVPTLAAFASHPVRVEAGGAVAFVVSVDSFERF
ncbi:MAG: cyclic-di-AMP receptor [Armatimonadota bacterium]|nr:cyclic-di-AMP receptor [Armatimonadota bacterium]